MLRVMESQVSIMDFTRLPTQVVFAAMLLLATLIGYIDWSTGYYISLLAFYALPIVGGVLLCGNRAGLVVFLWTGAACLIARHFMPDMPLSGRHTENWNALMRLITLFFFYLGAASARFRFEALKARERTLTGLLPMCNCCKKIRDADGYWSELESYLSEHSEADVEHKLCPDCSKRIHALTPSVFATHALPPGA